MVLQKLVPANFPSLESEQLRVWAEGLLPAELSHFQYTVDYTTL